MKTKPARTRRQEAATRSRPVVSAEDRRALAERAAALLEHPVDYIFHASFDDRAAESEIVGPPPTVKRAPTVRPPAGLPPYLASLYDVPLLRKEEEVYYFRKMNFLKYRAARLLETLNPKRASESRLSAIERLLHEATETRNLLIRTNLRLVVAVAKKCTRGDSNFFEVVSDGNVSLMRAIDKFDFSRGFKFSTYATWAIRRNFARTIPAEYTRLGRFRTGIDEFFSGSKDERSSQYAEERTNRQQHVALTKIMDQLQDRERDIIALRYGLGDELEPLTLEEVGSRFGVTKERIRQLEARALKKLREIAGREKLDVLGV